MPSVKELLDQAETYTETGQTKEDNVYCVIDPETRTIDVTEQYSLLGVESDEKAERVWFQCPKIVGNNIDLSKLQIRINYQNANSQTDQYIVTDVQTDGDNIVFSWLLSRKVTAYRGNVSFIVCAVKVSGETIQNEWNTTLATAQVLQGLEVEEPEIPEEESDVIAQLIELMNESVESSSVYATQAQQHSSNAETYKGQAQGYVTQAQQYAKQAQDAAEQAQEAVDIDPSKFATAEQGNKADTAVQTVNSKSGTSIQLSASDVGADPQGTASMQVSQHNTLETAHNDIRLLVQGLTERLNALADSDDDTLDQLSEIVAYIKNNKSLIDGITTSKVSVSDIIDNLTTNVSNKPLSAAQGVVLKGLIDAISIPTKLPNPQSLTIKTVQKGGSSNQVIYDGSQAKSIEISPEMLGLDEDEPASSGQVILLKSVDLTSWAQNNVISVPGMSDYNMIGISVISNTGVNPYDVSGIQWYKIPVSESIKHSIMATTYDREGMVMEMETRLIQIDSSSEQITSVSKGYYYSWMGVGNDETHAVPYEIYGMKL